MNLDKQFRRMVFVQVLLGVLAFCIAERNPGLMLVAGSLTVLSRYLTEGPSAWQMPRWLLNALAMAAVAWLMMDLGYQRGNVIVAMGHFTMWLQILLLYAPRSNRDYGQILVLSLMLMIGASILSVSMVYGVLLAAYCGLGLWTVLRFQLKSTADEVLAHDRRAAGRGVVMARVTAGTSASRRWPSAWCAAPSRWRSSWSCPAPPSLTCPSTWPTPRRRPRPGSMIRSTSRPAPAASRPSSRC